MKANASTAWFDPAHPHPQTPGVRVALREVSRQKVNGKTEVSYSVETSGFPGGQSYTLYMKSSLVPPGEKIPEGKGGRLGGFEADASGMIFRPAIAGRKASAGVTLSIHDYLRGEALDVAVIADDGPVFGYAEAMPFPIEGRDGVCYVFVRPLAVPGEPAFETFGIYGLGFEPKAKLTVVDRMWPGGKADQREEETDGDGSFRYAKVDLLPEREGGDESVTVSGPSCSVTVQFLWGPSATKKANVQ